MDEYFGTSFIIEFFFFNFVSVLNPWIYNSSKIRFYLYYLVSSFSKLNQLFTEGFGAFTQPIGRIFNKNLLSKYS